MARKLSAVSLFSGCGGFDWGAQQAGINIIWANDIDPQAGRAYRALLPQVHFVPGDVREIREFPQADILIGCYPCTGFSMAARRRWKNREERDLFANNGNFLYEEFVRALQQIQPKYFFVENVKGMITAEDGWFLKAQTSNFERLGYTVKHQLLDAADYGVPQTRKRMFIVGVRDEAEALDYKFPAPMFGYKLGRPYQLLRDAIGDMDVWPEGEFIIKPFHGHYLTRNRKRNWDEPSFTIVAHAHHVPLHPIGEPMKFVKKDTWSLQGKLNRRLSWRECAVIQGLPPEAFEAGRLTDKYRVVGNAVPPALGKALLEPITKFESAR